MAKKYIDVDFLREKIVREVEQWKEKTANHYTIEAEARWSEANYILDILDSLQQEQQESSKGKFVFPNFLYARTVDNKTIDVSYAPQSMDAVEYIKNDPTEQPEVDLEKEIDECWQNWLSPSNQKEVEGVLPKTEFTMYARHFAEWGAEHLRDSTKIIDKSLEEEIETWIPAHISVRTDETLPLNPSELADVCKEWGKCIARHFTEWQKSQMLKDAVGASVNTYELVPGGSAYVEFVADMPIARFRSNDKVRLIVLKEEEE